MLLACCHKWAATLEASGETSKLAEDVCCRQGVQGEFGGRSGEKRSGSQWQQQIPELSFFLRLPQTILLLGPRPGKMAGLCFRRPIGRLGMLPEGKSKNILITSRWLSLSLSIAQSQPQSLNPNLSFTHTHTLDASLGVSGLDSINIVTCTYIYLVNIRLAVTIITG